MGTADYISPDVLAGLNSKAGAEYGVEVDLWSLGVVLFELITGELPFFADCLLRTYHKIINFKESLNVDRKDISGAARSLLTRLLCGASERATIAQVKAHPYLASYPWDAPKEAVRGQFLPSPVADASIYLLRDDRGVLLTAADHEEPYIVSPSHGHGGRAAGSRTFEGIQLPFVGFTWKSPEASLTAALGAYPPSLGFDRGLPKGLDQHLYACKDMLPFSPTTPSTQSVIEERLEGGVPVPEQRRISAAPASSKSSASDIRAETEARLRASRDELEKLAGETDRLSANYDFLILQYQERERELQDLVLLLEERDSELEMRRKANAELHDELSSLRAARVMDGKKIDELVRKLEASIMGTNATGTSTSPMIHSSLQERRNLQAKQQEYRYRQLEQKHASEQAARESLTLQLAEVRAAKVVVERELELVTRGRLPLEGGGEQHSQRRQEGRSEQYSQRRQESSMLTQHSLTERAAGSAASIRSILSLGGGGGQGEVGGGSVLVKSSSGQLYSAISIEGSTGATGDGAPPEHYGTLCIPDRVSTGMHRRSTSGSIAWRRTQFLLADGALWVVAEGAGGVLQRKAAVLNVRSASFWIQGVLYGEIAGLSEKQSQECFKVRQNEPSLEGALGDAGHGSSTLRGIDRDAQHDRTRNGMEPSGKASLRSLGRMVTAGGAEEHGRTRVLSGVGEITEKIVTLGEQLERERRVLEGAMQMLKVTTVSLLPASKGKSGAALDGDFQQRSQIAMHVENSKRKVEMLTSQIGSLKGALLTGGKTAHYTEDCNVDHGGHVMRPLKGDDGRPGDVDDRYNDRCSPLSGRSAFEGDLRICQMCMASDGWSGSFVICDRCGVICHRECHSLLLVTCREVVELQDSPPTYFMAPSRDECKRWIDAIEDVRRRVLHAKGL